MQTNSLLYSLSKQNLRRFSWKVTFSFERNYDPSITFFTIGTSEIGGPDSLPGSSNVIQEWDKYSYTDFSDRVISIDDVTAEEDFPYSVCSRTADITLNNYDGFFDPDGTSSLAPYVLPFRPVRIWLGFDDQYVPVFTGLTDGMPVIDEENKTASFHCIDFLSFVYDKSMDLMGVLTDVRTDEVLDEALQQAGLTSSQYDLDTGQNTIDVFFAEKGSKFVDIVRPLIEAEQGSLFMTEEGRIQFRNRANVSTDIVHAFEKYRDIIEAKKRREDQIINTVVIKSDIRTLQAKQSVWQLADPVIVPGSGTVTIWADLADPCATITTPTASTTGDSGYLINTASDGSGIISSDVTLTSSTLYGSSYKMVFTNVSAGSLYVSSIILYGTPYSITDQIYVRETDSASVTKYGERLYEVTNNNFQNESTAEAMASIMIDDHNEYGAISEIQVKGTPQFQLGDRVSTQIDGKLGTGTITKIQMSMTEEGFKQRLFLKEYTRRTYFTVGRSLIGGTDYISF